MSGINGYDPNTMSSLFSSMGAGGTSSTASNGLYGINLSDYASIKNGSYGKLMKSYYALDEDKDVKDKKSKTIPMIRMLRFEASRLHRMI